jgi:uracil-DNA glycosylase family 4
MVLLYGIRRMDEQIIKLDLLALEISDCRLCEGHGMTPAHLAAHHRGDPHQLLVIGVQPEKSELHPGRPLEGHSGRLLLSWLVKAGLGHDTQQASDRIYYTTLSKCHFAGGRGLARAIQNCGMYLEREIGLVAPPVCVTLGREPLETLFHYPGTLESAVGRSWREREIGINLFPVLPDNCEIVPLPKPSAATAWLKHSDNAAAFERAIAALGRLVERMAQR